MRIAVLGAGAVGARAARQLASTDGVRQVLVHDIREGRVRTVVESLGGVAQSLDQHDIDLDAVVVALPSGRHAGPARHFLSAGVPVVSTSDAIEDVEALLDLDAEARERRVPLVVGVGFSPGLTCLLVQHVSRRLDVVDEVHVAKVGTGGPACARQHHRALSGTALEWRDGGWVRLRAGTGRSLSWFPDPVRGRDCYRAALPDSLLLVRLLPDVARVTTRLGANRRDRITARVPMLRRPHAEGGPGAVRVEVRGRRGDVRSVHVLGAIDRSPVAAGAVAAVTASWAARGGLRRPGAGGLAELTDSVPFLHELARRGVKAAVFEGADAAVA